MNIYLLFQLPSSSTPQTSPYFSARQFSSIIPFWQKLISKFDIYCIWLNVLLYGVVFVLVFFIAFWNVFIHSEQLLLIFQCIFAWLFLFQKIKLV